MSTVSLGVPIPLERPTPLDRGPRPPRPSSAGIRARLSSRRRRARPIALPSAPAVFPWLASRFAPGEATIWTGPSSALESMLELLYAGSAAARGRISLIEGANRFDPYRIGEVGRSLGLDASAPLDRLRIARPFTAHQTVALVDAWSEEARRHPPTLLVGHGLTTPFDDPEVGRDERSALLGHIARALAELLEERSVPLLLPLERGLAQFPGLVDDGPRLFDYVRASDGRGGRSFTGLRDGARLWVVDRPLGQRGLLEFAELPETEVIRWGARSRRTAKRSRSG